MADVKWNYDTLDEALSAHGGHLLEELPLPLSDWEAQKWRIFRSVFRTDALQPTPDVTPLAGSVAAAAVSSRTQENDDLILSDVGGTADDDQASFDRAWQVVSARIALPLGAAMEDSFGTLAPESQPESPGTAAAEDHFRQALRLVLHADTLLPRATQTQDLLSWHTQQVHRHYAQHVLPLLSACTESELSGRQDDGSGSGDHYYDDHMAVVQHSVRTLEAASRLYFYGLMLIVRGLASDSGDDSDNNKKNNTDMVISRFRQDVHALVANSAPQGLMVSIRIIMTRITGALLGVSSSPERSADSTVSKSTSWRGHMAGSLPQPKPPAEDDTEVRTLRQRMHEMLASLHDVGLAGRSFQILFAETMDCHMISFIGQSFAGRWTDPTADADAAVTTEKDAAIRRRSRLSRAGGPPSTNIATLHDWIEKHFARLAHEVLDRVGRDQRDTVSLSDVAKWKEVALGRLSALRMAELFDIVLHWPHSRGGLVDLRVTVTTPQRRSQLIVAFTASLRKQLLIPACSTLEILQTYIAMIRTFHALDPSNVLLSSVVGQLQMYICQRDDAVRIVVDGLLAEPDEDVATTATVAERVAAATATGTTSGKLVELASILNDPSQQRRRHIDEEELDWDDMDWVPDPIDAGTNYRRPKSEDVIGTLINALGSREAFTKEFQNIIAERLLSSQAVFAKEVKVLNLLKKRFGEGSMQNCEVMIRDIQDSNRLDALIHQLLRQQDHSQGQNPLLSPWSRQQQKQQHDEDVQYQAKILSRLYWPGLDREHFLLPRPVADMQKRYESGYETRKSSRKLAWLNQLGRASVELELADRTVSVECKTYEATVIYAFQQEPTSDSLPATPVRRSVSELVDMLQADEDLVETALAFWQQQGVLRHDAGGGSSGRPDTYVVVERLGQDEEEEEEEAAAATMGFASAPTTDADNSSSSRQARADDAQRTVYWQFIVGMLTNSAASMPLAQIAMMMKMLMAEGFPWSNEELLEFLGEKVMDGELEVIGGKYRLVKK
ncbi:anaphase-promoting complex subunit [Grosmannia clavigera kw1407]|uniref:Anaphase-promoting complex subunit 2 n=1 Tax=Grosmannia clavigera (strain kw1407 / UAMH 11150) TaxID=655863 RepID=F0XE13_GROCL|nr:anaphase-promoting complex subunit [Grosmannia clavigera kw1407]EFX03722.1 anaphase-promoting complex subunit [Grosmannia clavigera kw1407]